jgi:hypothetical protein
VLLLWGQTHKSKDPGNRQQCLTNGTNLQGHLKGLQFVINRLAPLPLFQTTGKRQRLSVSYPQSKTSKGDAYRNNATHAESRQQ